MVATFGNSILAPLHSLRKGSPRDQRALSTTNQFQPTRHPPLAGRASVGSGSILTISSFPLVVEVRVRSSDGRHSRLWFARLCLLGHVG
eukprot:3672818-Prymnesium_polylepis.1